MAKSDTETAFRRWRKACGLTQAQARDVLGLSLSRIEDLDRGWHRATRAPAIPDRRTRLAMRALADNPQLTPWPDV